MSVTSFFFADGILPLPPVNIAGHQLLVVIDLGLQSHLDTQQVLVHLQLALHMGPHLLQLLFQVQDCLVVQAQSIPVLHLGEPQVFLQSVDLQTGQSRAEVFPKSLYSTLNFFLFCLKYHSDRLQAIII